MYEQALQNNFNNLISSCAINIYNIFNNIIYVQTHNKRTDSQNLLSSGIFNELPWLSNLVMVSRLSNLIVRSHIIELQRR